MKKYIEPEMQIVECCNSFLLTSTDNNNIQWNNAWDELLGGGN